MPTYFCIRSFAWGFPKSMDYHTSIRQTSCTDDMAITLDDFLKPLEIAGFSPHYVSEEIPLGQVYYVEDGSGVLGCILFSPFSSNPYGFKEVLLGKGIADRVQLLIAEDLLRRYSPDQMVISTTPTHNRKKQLRRLGIEPTTSYTLSEYVFIIQSHIEGKK